MSTHQERVDALDHAAGKLPEATEYVLRLIIPAINQLVESRVHKDELAAFANAIAGQLQDRVTKSDMSVIGALEGALRNDLDSLVSAVVSLSDKMTLMKTAVAALAEKVDATATPGSPGTALISGTLNQI